jgi:4,5-dihydroxyphthalate decarboxylase
MNRVKLTIATTDYDHFRDFRLGLVNAEGINHTWLTLGHHEIFARFTFNREWDVSEHFVGARSPQPISEEVHGLLRASM